MKKSQQLFIMVFLWLGCIFPVNALASVREAVDVLNNNIEETQLYKNALNGDAKAQFDLASYYSSFKNPDYQTILLWLQRSANQDFLEAQFALGKIYQFGKPGITPDLIEAEKWYEKAAQKGDKQALEYLNFLRKRPAYQVSSQATIEDKWDIKWISQTAGYGDAQSQFDLGRLYAEGKKIPMDYEKAVQWYEKAALQNHHEAMYALAGLYLEGKGVSSDLEKALFWYNQAALRDYIPAQQKLYEIYVSSDNGVFDAVKASGWLYVSLKFLFPDETDLTKVSPQLDEIWQTLNTEQKEQVLYFVYAFIDENRR
ncbi:MAG: sel1 repeat family protein [Alphaproteobacteria bacterium]|nr:sel1 repeat family protein [Alphaproteobacteria bacterium]